VATLRRQCATPTHLQNGPFDIDCTQAYPSGKITSNLQPVADCGICDDPTGLWMVEAAAVVSLKAGPHCSVLSPAIAVGAQCTSSLTKRQSRSIKTMSIERP
jgi:hypothetical protein